MSSRYPNPNELLSCVNFFPNELLRHPYDTQLAIEKADILKREIELPNEVKELGGMLKNRAKDVLIHEFAIFQFDPAKSQSLILFMNKKCRKEAFELFKTYVNNELSEIFYCSDNNCPFLRLKSFAGEDAVVCISNNCLCVIILIDCDTNAMVGCELLLSNNDNLLDKDAWVSVMNSELNYGEMVTQFESILTKKAFDHSTELLNTLEKEGLKEYGEVVKYVSPEKKKQTNRKMETRSANKAFNTKKVTRDAKCAMDKKVEDDMMKLEAQRNHYKKQSQAKSAKQKKGNV